MLLLQQLRARQFRYRQHADLLELQPVPPLGHARARLLLAVIRELLRTRRPVWAVRRQLRLHDQLMNDACPDCPCADICLRREAWCLAMAAPEPSPMLAKSICDRSRIEHAKSDGPGLIQVVGNALAAAGRVAVAVAKGEAVRVPADVRAARLSICEACEDFNPESRRCRHVGCGCFLDVKTWGATEACPRTPPKWERWEPTES